MIDCPWPWEVAPVATPTTPVIVIPPIMRMESATVAAQRLGCCPDRLRRLAREQGHMLGRGRYKLAAAQWDLALMRAPQLCGGRPPDPRGAVSPLRLAILAALRARSPLTTSDVLAAVTRAGQTIDRASLQRHLSQMAERRRIVHVGRGLWGAR